MKYYNLLIFQFIFFIAQGQIVSIDPAIFSLDQSITITYDASKGSAGLIGVDQVFAHTGIISQEAGPGNWQNVQGNWGVFDAKVQMTSIGNDLHQLSFIPNDFYELAGNETVTQLAFVFRNEDGSKEGKTADLTDIFVDLQDPNSFSGSFLSPDEQHIVVMPGETFEVKVLVTQMSEITLFDNGVQIATASGTELNHTIIAGSQGDHELTFTADNGSDNISATISYIVLQDDVIVEDPPFNLKSGLNRISGERVILSLFAPMKEHVFVIGDFNDWQLTTDYQMKLSSDMENWWLDISGLNNDWHAYQYLIDGNIKIADPYSELILDDQNDAGISDDLQSVPITYPRAFTSGHATAFKTIKNDYDWQNDSYAKPAQTDLVIYEIMMRDFLEDHSFNSLIDTLSYLKDLGVNALELMPVSEFENNQSWGYNVSYHMALDKYYGSPDSFKRLVDEAHALGIAVILDVVYNHAFGQSPLVRMYWDKSNNRPDSLSPYFNPIAKHPYNVGFDFNHESEATQEFMLETLEYWINEFHIDGFRFDLSKGFTQKQSNNDADFAAFDINRVLLWNKYSDFLRGIDDELFLILEHFATNSEELNLAGNGFMLWGNANYNFNEATMGYTEGNKSNFGHIYYPNRSFSDPNIIGYMESHDEERLMYKNNQYGNMAGDYDVRHPEVGLDRVEMASAFFFAIPGPKMIWQFGELGYDFSINRCTDGSVDPDCRLAPKPIRWDYQDDTGRATLREVYRKLIDLKINYAAIKDGDVDMDVGSDMKRIKISHPDGNLIVVGNFGVEDGEIDPQFHHDGTWVNYLKERKYEGNTSGAITLKPGAFEVFIDDTSIVNDIKSTTLNQPFIAYPNPVSDRLFIDFEFSEILIYDIKGNLILKHMDQGNSVNLKNLINGIYFVKVMSPDGKYFTTRVNKI